MRRSLTILECAAVAALALLAFALINCTAPNPYFRGWDRKCGDGWISPGQNCNNRPIVDDAGCAANGLDMIGFYCESGFWWPDDGGTDDAGPNLPRDSPDLSCARSPHDSGGCDTAIPDLKRSDR